MTTDFNTSAVTLISNSVLGLAFSGKEAIDLESIGIKHHIEVILNLSIGDYLNGVLPAYRQRLENTVLFEMSNAYGTQFEIFRNYDGTFEINCIFNGINFKSFEMDSFKDCITVIELITKPTKRELSKLK